MRARFFSRYIAPLTALALLVAVIPALIGPAAPPARAASFTFFNNTHYPNADLGTNFGLTNSTIVYDMWNMSCSTTGCTGEPSQSTYEAQVSVLRHPRARPRRQLVDHPVRHRSVIRNRHHGTAPHQLRQR
jgi:hypothetical protein